MKRKSAAILLCASLCGVPVASLATRVEAGGTPIDLPPPASFVEVTPRMAAIWSFLQSAPISTNRVLSYYIEKEDAPTALQGKMPNQNRIINVQVLRAFEERKFNTAEFAGFKDYLAKNNGSQTSSPAFVEAIEETNGNIRALREQNIELVAESRVVMPAHQNEDRRMAYSSFSVISASSRDTDTKDKEFSSSVTTTTAVLVNERILFVYVTGASDDLKWTRQTADLVSASILSAN